jgi:hypothetical protein
VKGKDTEVGEVRGIQEKETKGKREKEGGTNKRGKGRKIFLIIILLFGDLTNVRNLKM